MAKRVRKYEILARSMSEARTPTDIERLRVCGTCWHWRIIASAAWISGILTKRSSATPTSAIRSICRSRAARCFIRRYASQ